MFNNWAMRFERIATPHDISHVLENKTNEPEYNLRPPDVPYNREPVKSSLYRHLSRHLGRALYILSFLKVDFPLNYLVENLPKSLFFPRSVEGSLEPNTEDLSGT